MATVYEFNYTGSEQSVTLKPGRYKLECWGACGGGMSSTAPSQALGGYTCGELTLKKETVLYIYVGQSGHERVAYPLTVSLQGYNFGYGAKSYTNGTDTFSLRGGGATDIRLVGGEWDNEQGLLSRIIVAGGGGSLTYSSFSYMGLGGGFIGGIGVGGGHSCAGGTQYEGGRAPNDLYSGSFGIGGGGNTSGGGGWFGGAGTGNSSIGGGSGYALTKDSYKPKGYIPTSEYWLENVESVTGGNTSSGHGCAKITLLQALPFLTVSFYNSTQATFKADHTDPTLLTKIEYFIDDTLKETITTDLTLEKTINYTLEDNALHTLKIVVTDSANATTEKVVSISKNIMPLGDDASLQDIASKVGEMKEGLKSGKRSIINVLELKGIDASLSNTFVELSEKVKDYFDSADSLFQEANKGKELIATAIGSPATSEQTFQEYANYIKGFKNTITNQNTDINNLNLNLVKLERCVKQLFFVNELPNVYYTASQTLNNTKDKNNFYEYSTAGLSVDIPIDIFTDTKFSLGIEVVGTYIYYSTPGNLSTANEYNATHSFTLTKREAGGTKDLTGERGCTVRVRFDSFKKITVSLYGGVDNSSRHFLDVVKFNINCNLIY
ncbi:glycine rich domain-containing protein [Clostridioides difficile]